jgi:glycosyltransferase involved in cell wall biosynthesis
VARHLFHLFPTFAVGGSQMRLSQIANHFGPRYRHTIFATDGVYDALALLGPQVEVRRLEVRVDKHRGLRNLPLFRRLYGEIKPDAVITHNWGTVEWALATRLTPGLRHTHIEDGFGPDEAQRQLRRRVVFRRLALGGRRTTVVVPSQVLYQIATQIWKLSPQKVRLIANGIDVSRFSGADEATAHALVHKTPGEVLVGTVASLRPEKNLGLLIASFMALPSETPARLFIVGSGPELERLKRIAGELGAGRRIVFFGHVPKPETIMRAFDVFAMSSATEQMPIGLLEAMACGLPVASTDVGDIANMVAPDNRVFVTPPGDVAALAGSLKQLIENARMRQTLGAHNLAKVSAQYDQKLMFAAYEKLFG